MAETDDWPSLGQELGRKTSEVIDKWMTAYETGRITLKEFYLIVVSVYDSTSGLAPRDISAMLANIEKELRDEAARRKTAKAGV
ncbi:hypothetical protein B9J07_27995 [Sinorhizobium sp. LM21]|uniref:hypothetical protein n=1 Tax=Sinorhizobium sp. LM21 TaxID=1449788 RepID=UPI0005D8C33D|nr:hypothetical protein [Sinorhizobium sp. LM21]AJW30165.1 hypothetical protein pLM21S1_p45 [Sinorhizobium sp. LM21]OWZ90432.1 hypothetical protein B9J07_27995 [Sinorhizobium sp. LM21]